MAKGSKVWMYWGAQIIGWGLFHVLIFSLSYFSGGIFFTPKLIYYFLFSFFLSITITHLLRVLIIQFNWLKLNIWALVFRSFLGALLFAVINEGIDFYASEWIHKDYITNPTNEPYTISNFFGGTLLNWILFSLWLSFYYTYLFVEKSRNQEIKNLQFEASKNEIELKNLREQINPHFLFNSLNSIKALVEINKNEAKDAITKLSNLLRKSMQLSKNKLITIRDEMEIVDNYIELEKIRFEERINSTFNIDAAALNCKIPPLMIQTLVENGIKHGLSKEIDGGELILNITKKKQYLSISIINTGTLNNKLNTDGIGLKNTQKRLRILFGESAFFKIYQENKMVRVDIKINCKE